MKPINFDSINSHLELYMAEYGRRSMSYPELCSEFLITLVKSIKSGALYTLSHPVVIESLRKDYALLNMVFAVKKDSAMTLAFMNDAWLFNDTLVPAITQESQNLNAFFRAHGIHDLTFLNGVQFFELGVLCEFLGSSSKNQPEGYFKEFLSQRGVNNIRSEATHFVKENVYDHNASVSKSASESMFRTSAPPKVPESSVGEAPRETISRSNSALTPDIKSKPEPSVKSRAASQKDFVFSSEVKSKIESDIKPQVASQSDPVFAPDIKPKPEPNVKSRSASQKDLVFSSDVESKIEPDIKPQVASQPDPAFAPDIKSKSESDMRPRAKHVKQEPGKMPVAAPQPEEKQKPKKSDENVLTSMSFGIILSRIVESAVKSPQERVNVYKDVLKLIRNSIKQEVDKTTEALVGEKNRILNTRTRTEKVLSKVAEGKVILDKDGNILMMNPVAEEISGKKFIDVVGKHISEHIKPGEHFLAISKDMDIAGGDTISGEVDVVGDVHVERSMRRSMALLEDDQGRVVGAYTTIPEITKFKETQRMQEEFLSRVTHDLQTPLSSVSSALEMLVESGAGKLNPIERKFLDISIRNSLRLNQMIKGILDFSKLQSGKIDMHPEPSSVSAMLSEAGEGLLPWAKKRELKLVIRLSDPDIYVMADYQRIVQVLTNLISNAVKSTPRGGVITVAASPSPNNERSAIIGVRDTGRGILKEDLKKVFDKFVQLNNSSETSEGVGLGLSIVNEFVTLHGGKVWAKSEVGKGTTFYFTLPMAEEN